jgi:hypothetical protein
MTSCTILKLNHIPARISSFSVLGPASASGPVPTQTPSSVYKKNRTDQPTSTAFAMRRSFECSTKFIITRLRLGFIYIPMTERAESNCLQQIKNTKVGQIYVRQDLLIFTV